MKLEWNTKYEFSWRCKKTKFTTGQIVNLKIKKKQVKPIKVVKCNINAAIKLQCTYNEAIRTLFAQCTLPKYRDLSTNNMRRYWSCILLWQYYYHYPKSVCIFLWIQCTKSSMELVWKCGRLSSIPFLKSSIPFHSGILHIPYRNFRSIPFHTMPWGPQLSSSLIDSLE